MRSSFLEISTLFEKHWTGLAVVTAAIAQEALLDSELNWVFFSETIIVPREIVRELLQNRSAANGRGGILSSLWEKQDIPYSTINESPAVFGFLKTQRAMFHKEAAIVYDLSPLLTSRFHEPQSATYFADRFRYDVDTTDHFFCISDATRQDLLTYFRLEASKATVIPMGVDLSIFDISAAQAISQWSSIEPYVLILGTLEPRKNGQIVLRYLLEDRGFAQRYRIVFVGRNGWLGERERLLQEVRTAGVDQERILFTDFVTEPEKTALIQSASFCIYPSYFEGYGLPILEAATLGKIIVCSGNSSMPEVAPENSCFFDPDDISDFRIAVSKAERRSQQLKRASTLPDLLAEISARSWKSCYEPIAEWVKQP